MENIDIVLAAHIKLLKMSEFRMAILFETQNK